MELTEELVRRTPKVLLHDHLDGGLRPATVRELAAEVGHLLPADEESALAAWFHQGGRGADLARYLEAFDHTVAVLQTPAAITRVARECGEDLDADGVVYAEVRYAPELSTTGGLELAEVLDAWAAGFAAAPATIELRMLVCAMRNGDRAGEVVDAAIAARDRGLPVVGVDLAGPEVGFPAARHAAALKRARAAGLHVTLHAGEAEGPGSVADALEQGAERLGHGVRIIEDRDATGQLGPIARRVRDEGTVLEVCPTSNLHTGIATSYAAHPVQRLREAGFAVTISTDNRLMSGISLTGELLAGVRAFGWTLDDLEHLAWTALAGAFCDEPTRATLAAVIERGFASVRP
ncbi:MAG: adenosine deaminase [Nitriliruptoraceae bacterium]